MGHADEGSDPTPPDIRPFGRSLQANDHPVSDAPPSLPTHVSANSSNQTQHATNQQRVGHKSTARTTTSTTLKAIHAALLVALLCLLPVATARNVVPDPIGATWNLQRGAAGPSPSSTTTKTKTNHTPILSFLSWGATWILKTASNAFGFELVPVATRHWAKREHVEMNTTHIVEAVMIPVLVVLSGTFAGLTLG